MPTILLVLFFALLAPSVADVELLATVHSEDGAVAVVNMDDKYHVASPGRSDVLDILEVFPGAVEIREGDGRTQLKLEARFPPVEVQSEIEVDVEDADWRFLLENVARASGKHPLVHQSLEGGRDFKYKGNPVSAL